LRGKGKLINQSDYGKTVLLPVSVHSLAAFLFCIDGELAIVLQHGKACLLDRIFNGVTMKKIYGNVII
jgi:hypothetical protein